MKLLDFIKATGHEPPYALRQFERVDKAAVKVGAELVKRYPNILELQHRKGSPWLRENCLVLGAALTMDPSGRLAAANDLYAWSYEHPDIGPTWVGWYLTYLKEWLITYS